MIRPVVSTLAAVLMIANSSASELRIPAYKAPFYVGQTVMACGVIAQVAKGKKARYLNFDKRYPDQTLSILIWKNNVIGFKERFGYLKNLENKRVCARGEIKEYKNSLQIHISNPQFLRLMK